MTPIEKIEKALKVANIVIENELQKAKRLADPKNFFMSGGIVPGPSKHDDCPVGPLTSIEFLVSRKQYSELVMNKTQRYNMYAIVGKIPKCYRARNTFKLKHYKRRFK